MNRDRLTGWLENGLAAVLPGFLAGRRWFGGKARPVAAAAVEDYAWLPVDAAPAALVIAGVRFEDGGEERYALLLAFGDGAGLPLVSQLEIEGERVRAVEASADPAAAIALLQGFASSSPRVLPMRRGGVLRYQDVDDEAGRAFAPGPQPPLAEALGREQSNTSLRVDRRFAFKLIRKLSAGENPEIEMGRFLATRTTFRAVPMLRGSLAYEPAGGGPATLGVLQDWIDSHGDGWSHVVAQVKRHDPSHRAALLDEIATLGTVTAALHAALASDPSDPDFAPEPATAADVTSWRAALADRAACVAALIERHAAEWPDEARRPGAQLLEACRAPGSSGLLPPLTEVSTPFAKIRVHGDYHLGQTLKTPGGFVLIDFEGEPARPLAERRAKHAAFKDVAGMTRSFDYAVEAAARESGDTEAPAGLAAALRRSFLDGYRASVPAGAPFVPATRRAFDDWVRFFEVDKALYEVEYELNNRPAWVSIPLRGLARLLGHAS